MDKLDKQILNYIQSAFPLVNKPYKDLAITFGLRESEIIQRIEHLKRHDNIIYTISGIFDAHKLGYTRALVAMQVTKDHIPDVVTLINNHPTISHNYERNNNYNIWFTIAEKTLNDIESFVISLNSKFDLKHYLILPSTKTYKLNSRFNLVDDNTLLIDDYQDNKQDRHTPEIIIPDKNIIKQLQKDLPLHHQPYKILAEEISIPVDSFLARAHTLLSHGIMRRYCASIRHARAGIAHNAMVVWLIKPERIRQVHSDLARLNFISHCYERKSYPDWPYNLYTMIHARSETELIHNIEIVKSLCHPDDYQALRTLQEFKKARPLYFQN